MSHLKHVLAGVIQILRAILTICRFLLQPLWRWYRDQFRLRPRLVIINTSVLGLAAVTLVIASLISDPPYYVVEEHDSIILILDIGHGGNDTGASGPIPQNIKHQAEGAEKLEEYGIVYDIGARIAALAADLPAVAVVPLATNRHSKLPIEDKLVPMPTRDLYLNTTPRYPLLSRSLKQYEETNLRWMLANALHFRLKKAERGFAFISLHVDSRIDGVAGVSIYVPPGSMDSVLVLPDEPYESYVEGRAAFVSKTLAENFRDHSLSCLLGREILRNCGDRDIEICTHQLMTEIRETRTSSYIPAVLHYNVIPMRVLVEVGNLLSREDRSFLADPDNRQRIAEAILEAVVTVHVRST